MPDLNTTLGQSNTPSVDVIVEPYNAPIDVIKHARKFFPEEVYNLSSETILYKFLSALLGDAGVGGMKKAITYARTQQTLSNVHFDDLDTLFTGPFEFVRQSGEIYNTDPANDLLTDAQWLEVRSKDANYRSRALDYVKGVNLGPTEQGYKLIARAATGQDAEIYEQWQYYDDVNSDSPVGFPNLGNTGLRGEIVVLPYTNGLTQQQTKHLNDAFNRVKSMTTPISFSAQGSAATNIPAKTVVSSSDFFYVQKTVTANPSIDYPTVTSSGSAINNLWIVPGQSTEAPTYAFSNAQESITYAPIQSASASSYHTGPFNQIQQSVFGYLQNVPSALTNFSADQSYVDNSNSLEISTPWSVRQDTLNLFVNQNYPVGYLALLENQKSKYNKTFWSSNENPITTTESLYIYFPTSTPVNLLEFEIGKKPISIVVNYLSNNNWIPVTLNNSVENTIQVHYDHSTIYQWQPAALTFNDGTNNYVNTTALRIDFIRNLADFPFNNPSYFNWSVDVRNLKTGLMIGKASDFVTFPGIDVLGNAFTTQLKTYSSSNVLNGQNSFWQSQSNPSQFAVESLYFDISDSQGNAQTFDQIYLDPLTIGNLMHVYYSNDSSTDVSASFGQGDIIWYDPFSGTGLLAGQGIWNNNNVYWQQNFPSFEAQYGTASSLSESGGVATFQSGSAYTLAGNITANQYGAGDTLITLSGPAGIGSYLEIDICIQGSANNTAYNIEYAPVNFASGAGTVTGGSVSVNMYNAGILTQSQSIKSQNLLLVPGDQIGIRNDYANNQAIGFVVQQSAGTTIIGTVSAYNYGINSYSSGTYGKGSAILSNYGQTAVIIEDPNKSLSITDVQFRALTNTSIDNWDYKLWNPVNRHFALQKGYMDLPNPITAKYVKLEFSKLTPTPYQGVYNPNLPLVNFKAYPSWVVAYINDIFSQITSLKQLKAEQVNYDLINTGVQQPGQTLLSDPQPVSLLQYVQELSSSDITQTVQSQYDSWFNIGGSVALNTPTNQVPQVYPNTLYQQDSLYQTVTNPNPLSQTYTGVNPSAMDNYAQETMLPIKAVGPITARKDDSIVAEKNYPNLWFPRVCRHGYQTVQTQRENKMAYNVAIKQVSFYRKNGSVATNDPFYFETLADISNADPTYPNTFVQSDWRFIVPSSTLSVGTNMPSFGFENFDVDALYLGVIL